MTKYYYKKRGKTLKIILRSISILLLVSGLAISFYTFLPLFSWQLYFSESFAAQSVNAPIPKTTVLNKKEISKLINSVGSSLSVDYTNAYNWFPTFNPRANSQRKEDEFYSISIPSIGIQNAQVATNDINLAEHLVNFTGTAVPPNLGNAVIFGHSTLPQLYNPKDYKTIFANAYKIKTGDEVFVNFQKITYKYKVTSIIVVDPTDTSVLEQDTRDSFLTLITCTPPGTVWKRLVIKSQLSKI